MALHPIFSDILEAHMPMPARCVDCGDPLPVPTDDPFSCPSCRGVADDPLSRLLRAIETLQADAEPFQDDSLRCLVSVDQWAYNEVIVLAQELRAARQAVRR